VVLGVQTEVSFSVKFDRGSRNVNSIDEKQVANGTCTARSEDVDM